MARPNYRERERSRSAGRRRPASIHTCTLHGNNAGHTSADCDVLEQERIVNTKFEDLSDELCRKSRIMSMARENIAKLNQRTACLNERLVDASQRVKDQGSRIEALESNCKVVEADIETVTKMAEDFNNMVESLNKHMSALDEQADVDTTGDDNAAGVAA